MKGLDLSIHFDVNYSSANITGFEASSWSYSEKKSWYYIHLGEYVRLRGGLNFGQFPEKVSFTRRTGQETPLYPIICMVTSAIRVAAIALECV